MDNINDINSYNSDTDSTGDSTRTELYDDVLKQLMVSNTKLMCELQTMRNENILLRMKVVNIERSHHRFLDTFRRKMSCIDRRFEQVNNNHNVLLSQLNYRMGYY